MTVSVQDYRMVCLHEAEFIQLQTSFNNQKQVENTTQQKLFRVFENIRYHLHEIEVRSVLFIFWFFVLTLCDGMVLGSISECRN